MDLWIVAAQSVWFMCESTISSVIFVDFGSFDTIRITRRFFAFKQKAAHNALVFLHIEVSMLSTDNRNPLPDIKFPRAEFFFQFKIPLKFLIHLLNYILPNFFT